MLFNNIMENQCISEEIGNEIKKLLACNTHIGEYTCQNLMKSYIWRQRKDGIFIIDILKTISKIKLASRAIVAIKNSENILSVSTGNIGKKGATGFSRFTGSKVSIGRWVPGKLTNQLCKDYTEPQLIILTNPETDIRPLKEASYVNLPTIAFSTTNTSLQFIDIAIPGNNTNKHSVAMLWWLLTREVLRLKGILSNSEEWDINAGSFMDLDNE